MLHPCATLSAGPWICQDFAQNSGECPTGARHKTLQPQRPVPVLPIEVYLDFLCMHTGRQCSSMKPSHGPLHFWGQKKISRTLTSLPQLLPTSNVIYSTFWQDTATQWATPAAWQQWHLLELTFCEGLKDHKKTLESPLDCKEIQPVHSEGDQPWDFFGRNDAKAETPVLWPPHTKCWLIGKDSDAGRDWGQEEKGMTEDEMAGWHHRLNGRESEWTPAVGDGQGGLACCDSWGHKESDMTEWLNWTEKVIILEQMVSTDGSLYWSTVLHLGKVPAFLKHYLQTMKSDPNATRV